MPVKSAGFGLKEGSSLRLECARFTGSAVFQPFATKAGEEGGATQRNAHEGGHGPFRGLDAPFALKMSVAGTHGGVNFEGEQETRD